MNLPLRFSNQGEVVSVASVVSAFMYLFISVVWKAHPKLVHTS